MLGPRKVKYRKRMKGSMKGISSQGSEISFGKYALKAVSRRYVTARQIEAARRAMTRHVKRGGKIWIRIFPDKPITRTSPETPMGGGKGSVDHYVAPVLPGRIIFEMDGVPDEVAYEALRLAASKLPVKTRIVTKAVRSEEAK